MTAVSPLTWNRLINDNFNGTQSMPLDNPYCLNTLACCSTWALRHNPQKYPFRKIRFKRIDSSANFTTRNPRQQRK